MGNKKRIWVAAVLIIAAVITVCAVLPLKSAADHALRISGLLQPWLSGNNQTMHLAASARINGVPLETESDISLVTEDGISFLVLERQGTAVYVADNVLFLENGKAFKLGDKLQTRTASYEKLLPCIGALYDTLRITVRETQEETAYSVTVTGAQVDTLLSAASLGEASAGIEKLELCLTERNGELARILFTGSGNFQGTSVSLNVTLSGFRVLGDCPIPEAVKQGVATVDPDGLFSLSEDLYRLVLALAPFGDGKSIDADLHLRGDCGLIQLDTRLRLSDLQTGANGQLDPEKLRTLPEMLGWLCMEGDLTCSRNGDSYSYELALDQTSMKELSRMILPELAQYGGDLTEGNVSIILQDNAITSMYVSIKGEMRVLFAQIPVTVGAEFIFD